MTVIGVITATRAEGVRQQEVSHFSSSILSCYSTPDDGAPQKNKKTAALCLTSRCFWWKLYRQPINPGDWQILCSYILILTTSSVFEVSWRHHESTSHVTAASQLLLLFSHPPPYLCKNYTAKRGVRQQARLLTATAITNELQAALPVVWWGYIHNRGN